MKANHTVKINGVWYRTGEEIPQSAPKVVEEPKVEEVEKTYSKSEIMRMSSANLRKLASEQGFENVDDMTGSELKTLLIEKLGL